MTRIVVLSDTHNEHEHVEVPDGDVVIHAGDALVHGTWEELDPFLKWFRELPHRHKIYVPGNHDGEVELLSSHANRVVESYGGVRLLVGAEVQIDDLRIFGAPWSRFRDSVLRRPERRGKHSAFAIHPDVIHEKWAQIPAGLDVLVTHVPPFEVLDRVSDGVRIGCPKLLERVVEVAPRYHFFGHVHETQGGVSVSAAGTTTWHNVAICDRRYLPVGIPTVIDL